MSRNTINLLLVFSGIVILLLLCSATTFVAVGRAVWDRMADSMTLADRRVGETGAQIADFVLPAGYRSDYAVNVAGFKMAGYEPGDGHSHILLMQIPRWLHLDQSKLVAMAQNKFGIARTMDVDEEQSARRHTVAIAGQEVEFLVTEGINSADQPYRTMTGLWEGANGEVLVMIEEPLASWDQDVVDAFLASIQ
jgi:hypothetical protein